MHSAARVVMLAIYNVHTFHQKMLKIKRVIQMSEFTVPRLRLLQYTRKPNNLCLSVWSRLAVVWSLHFLFVKNTLKTDILIVNLSGIVCLLQFYGQRYLLERSLLLF